MVSKNIALRGNLCAAKAGGNALNEQEKIAKDQLYEIFARWAEMLVHEQHILMPFLIGRDNRNI